MPAVFELLIAFLCAALSGMGVGGGGLLLIYLTMFGSMERRQAQLYNLIFFLCASAASLILHIRKRKIDIPVTVLLALTGVPGAVAGSIISRTAGDDIVGYALGGFLFVSGAITLFSKNEEK